MVSLSIVIVNWNTKEILKDCLRSVYEETPQLNFEIIVVDNDSSDGSVQMVQTEFPDVHLIANTANVGFAAANNIGFKVAKGSYILLLNSDTVVLDKALEKTMAYAYKNPNLGVISCKVLNKDLSLQPNCTMLPSLLNSFLFVTGLYKLFPKNRFFGRAAMTWWNYQDERDVEVLKGCFMLVKKEALEQVGGMDEQFFMYSEEVDWCMRFTQKGWKLRFFPDANIIHLGGISAAKLGGDRALIKDGSTRRYMKKHWSKPACMLGMFFMFLFYITRLPAIVLLMLSSSDSKYKKRFENHTAGLKGLFSEIANVRPQAKPATPASNTYGTETNE